MPQASVPTSSTASRCAEQPPFLCTWKEGGSGAAWVHLAGEVDLATSPQLKRVLEDARLHARLVVLDLRELTFMDSSAIHAIRDGARDARAAAGKLILVRGPAAVDRVLTLTRACDEVEIVDLAPTEPPAQALLHLAQKSAAA